MHFNRFHSKLLQEIHSDNTALKLDIIRRRVQQRKSLLNLVFFAVLFGLFALDTFGNSVVSTIGVQPFNTKCHKTLC